MYMHEKLKSRKFWLAVVSAVLVIMNEGLGWNVPSETVLTFAALILGWIFAEAYVDGKCACGDTIFIESEEE